MGAGGTGRSSVVVVVTVGGIFSDSTDPSADP